MSDSSRQPRQHLDATGSREVVYCHACSNEWYRDEFGLSCPRCGGEITEVVDPQEDPRDLSQPVPNSNDLSGDAYHPMDLSDSDPDEADIEEHLGPSGFQFRRSTVRGRQDSAHDDDLFDHEGHDHHHHHHHHHDHEHHNPAVDPVVQRFADMIQGFGPPTRVGGSPQMTSQGRTFQRTTFTSRMNGGGTASVTIFSTAAPPAGEHQRGPSDGDIFQDFLNNTLRNVGPPLRDEDHEEAPPNFARSLQDLLSLFNPGAPVGDAVYSQEALDRIISDLMEQNPQSNAAPPTSEEGLRNLTKEPVTEEMLREGQTTECTICLDEFEIGQKVAHLPCKHWFHEDCVVLWLKAHNTCPICRHPVETPQARASAGGSTGGEAGQGSMSGHSTANGHEGHGSSSNHPDPPEQEPGSLFGNIPQYRHQQHHSGGGRTIFRIGGGNFQATRPSLRVSRPPSQSQSTLNEAMRSISYMQREQLRERDRANAEAGYDTSRLQRRTSLSPTSPRSYSAAEMGSRMRQRSPSSSQRRRSPPDSGNSRQSSGGGALGWLRDRFGGGGGSSGTGGGDGGNAPSRDGRQA